MMRTRPRSIITIFILVVGLAWPPTAYSQEAPPTASRGVTGQIEFNYDGAPLQADPAQDLQAPLVLRLERDRDDPARYIARFIGSVEGEYDLTTLIQHVDGSIPADLAPLKITVISNLPDRVRSDLFDAADLDLTLAPWYRLLLVIIALAWIAAPAAYLWFRMRHRKPVLAPAPVAPQPTLADQLRPLVEAAASRKLEVAEQGRLELLLYAYWRHRLSLAGADIADAIRQIRTNPRSCELIQAVERWLHHPDQSGADQSRIAQLLSPYRHMAAVPDEQLAAARAPAEVPR